MLRDELRSNCLITGATSGIGLAAAVELARRGHDLILVGRDSRRGEALRRNLERRHPGGSFRFVSCDLASLEAVRAVGGMLVEQVPCLHVLLNNAGARFDTYQQSPDGVELTFATNHLGHFLLTALLWPVLLAAPAARIINVSSSAHASATPPGSWSMTAAGFDRRQAYARAKLANLLFTFELARRVPPAQVTVNAMHPGGVVSRFARNNGWRSWLRHVVAHALRRELLLPRQGADTIVHLATAPALDGVSGRYFFQRREAPVAPLALQPELGRLLWSYSLECCPPLSWPPAWFG